MRNTTKLISVLVALAFVTCLTSYMGAAAKAGEPAGGMAPGSSQTSEQPVNEPVTSNDVMETEGGFGGCFISCFPNGTCGAIGFNCTCECVNGEPFCHCEGVTIVTFSYSVGSALSN
jgi:hypothetical protein